MSVFKFPHLSLDENIDINFFVLVSETSEPPVEGDGAMRSWPPKSSATGLDPESISGRKMREYI